MYFALPSTTPLSRIPLEAANRPEGARGAKARFNVCMLAACPFPANHGTPGSIREMAEALAQRGHEVHLVTYHFGEDIPVRGPVLHRIAALTGERKVIVGPTMRRPLYDLQMVFKTLQVVRRYQPDLIHTHGYEAALVGCVCQFLTRTPVVYSGHNTMADELPSYRFIRPKWLATVLARLLDAVVPRLAQRCIPHSANLEQFFRRMGLGRRLEPIINFGIDLDMMAGGDGESVRRRYGLGDGPVVLYTGVLDEFQRLDLLLEAMQTVLWYEPRGKMLLVVTIPQEQHLAAVRRRADELGIAEHLIVTDPQSLEGVCHCLAAGDVAVVPRPQAPGFPIKLLNYLAAHKPCVLFASSASAGLRDGHNARLVAPDSSAALAEGILDLLRDSQPRQSIADNGHQFVRHHHDRLRIAHQVEEAYARTLANARRRRRPAQPSRVAPGLSEHAQQGVAVRRQPRSIQGPKEEAHVPAGETNGSARPATSLSLRSSFE